jgi:hypothetical protein
MQSPLLWSHITFQDCSVMPKKRSWDELERKVNKPKKSEFSAAAFLGYLKKNHRDVVVELDLSFTALESEVTEMIIVGSNSKSDLVVGRANIFRANTMFRIVLNIMKTI